MGISGCGLHSLFVNFITCKEIKSQASWVKINLFYFYIVDLKFRSAKLKASKHCNFLFIGVIIAIDLRHVLVDRLFRKSINSDSEVHFRGELTFEFKFYSYIQFVLSILTSIKINTHCINWLTDKVFNSIENFRKNYRYWLAFD